RLVHSPAAAAILQVTNTHVKRLTDSGLLTPVSGPGIDSFGLNLYMRSDVEKLHAEREAFKAKRAKEGKTSRFGGGGCPRSRPVQAMIGPRIEQLIEEWARQQPSQPVTGGRLHRQLISEGYQVGEDTVYVYLRRRRRQSA